MKSQGDENRKTYIARQPIYDLDKRVRSYELLFRNAPKSNVFPNIDGSVATRTLISEAMLTFDVETLANGHRAFVNFTYELLRNQTALLLSPDYFIIEVLEDVVFDEEIRRVLLRLKEAHYQIALDDYSGLPLDDDVLELVDIIKTDFRKTDADTRKRIAYQMKSLGKTVLAEKVETEEEFEQAKEYGYELVQGFFLSKPVILSTRAMDIAPISYVQLANALSAREISFQRIAKIVQVDAHLTFKLLRVVNRLCYYRGFRVTSIQQALVLMGTNEVRRWGMLVLLKNVLGDAMDEMLRTALVRALFCENIEESMHYNAGFQVFTAALLSIMDRETDGFKELAACLQMPSRSYSQGAGLLEFDDFVQVALLYEEGKIGEMMEFCAEKFPKLDVSTLPHMYIEAVDAADRTLTDCFGEDESI